MDRVSHQILEHKRHHAIQQPVQALLPIQPANIDNCPLANIKSQLRQINGLNILKPRQIDAGTATVEVGVPAYLSPLSQSASR